MSYRVHKLFTEKKTIKNRVTLTFDGWPWKSIELYRLSRYVCVQKFIKF